MNNLYFSFRNLVKHKVQSFVSILCIALAFCCLVLSIIWIRYETNYDSWHDNSNRIYRILNGTKSAYGSMTDAPLSQRLKDLFPEIEESATVLWWSYDRISYNGMALENCYETDTCFFRTFTVHFIEGDRHSSLIDQSTIVLTESTAVSFFGSPQEAMGKTLKGNDHEYVVSAVIKDFKHSNLYFNALVKMRPSGWKNTSYLSFCLLKENVDYTAFSKKLEKVFISELSNDEAMNLLAVPIAKMHYKYQSPEQQHILSYNYIVALAFATLLLFLCAITNFLSLFIGSLFTRLKELDVRRCVGAHAMQLFSLAFIQFSMILFMALLMGTFFIVAVKKILEQITQITVETNHLFGYIAISALLCIIITYLFAFFPVLRLSTLNLRKNSGAFSSRQWFRRTMVIIQFTVGIFFLFISVVIYRQLHFMDEYDVGYSRKNVIQIQNMNDITFHRYAERICDDLKQLDCVDDAYIQFFALQTPGGVTKMNGFTYEGVEFEEGLNFNLLFVNYGFPSFFDVPIRSGRFFSKELPTDFTKVLVNETLAKMIGTDPVGKELVYSGQRLEIIGVMADINDQPLTRSVEPAVITLQEGYFTLFIRAHEGRVSDVIAQTSNIFNSYGVSPIVNYKMMEDIFAEFSQSERVMMSFISIISIVCLTISIFGVYSLALSVMVSRRREVGIRRTFGAKVMDIVLFFCKDYLLLVLFSAVISLPVAYWLVTQWLQSYAYRITIGWATAAIVVVTVGVFVLITILRQVLKASNINPVEVIKYE